MTVFGTDKKNLGVCFFQFFQAKYRMPNPKSEANKWHVESGMNKYCFCDKPSILTLLLQKMMDGILSQEEKTSGFWLDVHSENGEFLGILLKLLGEKYQEYKKVAWGWSCSTNLTDEAQSKWSHVCHTCAQKKVAAENLVKTPFSMLEKRMGRVFDKGILTIINTPAFLLAETLPDLYCITYYQPTHILLAVSCSLCCPYDELDSVEENRRTINITETEKKAVLFAQKSAGIQTNDDEKKSLCLYPIHGSVVLWRNFVLPALTSVEKTVFVQNTAYVTTQQTFMRLPTVSSPQSRKQFDALHCMLVFQRKK